MLPPPLLAGALLGGCAANRAAAPATGPSPCDDGERVVTVENRSGWAVDVYNGAANRGYQPGPRSRSQEAVGGDILGVVATGQTRRFVLDGAKGQVISAYRQGTMDVVASTVESWRHPGGVSISVRCAQPESPPAP